MHPSRVFENSSVAKDERNKMGKIRLDPDLLHKLSQKLRKTEKYTREQIRKKATKHQVSSEAYFVHWLTLCGIGAETYRLTLNPGIQDEIREIGYSNRLHKNIIERGTKKIEKMLRIQELQIKPRSSFLSQSIIDEARHNAEIYPVLFLFENSVRDFIRTTLIKKYGTNWWETKISNKIKDRINHRIQKEQMNKWHGSRGIDPIFYTDFDDLSNILKANTAVFSPLFTGLTGGLNWLTQKLDELYFSRNNIAHSTPLKPKDINRFMLYFKDWYDQLDGLE